MITIFPIFVKPLQTLAAAAVVAAGVILFPSPKSGHIHIHRWNRAIFPLISFFFLIYGGSCGAQCSICSLWYLPIHTKTPIANSTDFIAYYALFLSHSLSLSCFSLSHTLSFSGSLHILLWTVCTHKAVITLMRIIEQMQDYRSLNSIRYGSTNPAYIMCRDVYCCTHFGRIDNNRLGITPRLTLKRPHAVRLRPIRSAFQQITKNNNNKKTLLSR